nr:MAG TPA: hypothetical protein [Bacteriophage sp.]
MLRLLFSLNTPAGRVDMRGVEPRSCQIISYTLYILCKCSDDQSEH